MQLCIVVQLRSKDEYKLVMMQSNWRARINHNEIIIFVLFLSCIYVDNDLLTQFCQYSRDFCMVIAHPGSLDNLEGKELQNLRGRAALGERGFLDHQGRAVAMEGCWSCGGCWVLVAPLL